MEAGFSPSGDPEAKKWLTFVSELISLLKLSFDPFE